MVPVPEVEPGAPTRMYQTDPAVAFHVALLVLPAQPGALSEHATTAEAEVGQADPAYTAMRVSKFAAPQVDTRA